jgi:hypothetical protein
MTKTKNVPRVDDSMRLTINAVDAICHFSAVIGAEPSSISYPSPQAKPPTHCHGIHWPGEKVDYLASLNITPLEAEFMPCDPDMGSDVDRRKMYTLIGYCAYHGIKWTAP